MKVAILTPKDMPESFRVCVQNIASRLSHYGCTPACSDDARELARGDVVWDPRAGGGCPPHETVLSLESPIVVTLHGVAPLAIPKEYESGILGRISLLLNNAEKKRAWRRLQARCQRIVTVSHFSKTSIQQHLGIAAEKIDVVYNGLDHDLFRPEGPGFSGLPCQGPYFLHISNDEPRKNVDGILRAYRQLDEKTRWPLVLKLSSRRRLDIPGVISLTKRLTDEEIAALYRSAGAFVFPSFYEGFGLPIVEAMATGCPVITANDNACAEVAGQSAVLVDPHAWEDIARGMQRVMEAEPRNALVSAGLVRARHFSWETAAAGYARIFAGVLG